MHIVKLTVTVMLLVIAKIVSEFAKLLIRNVGTVEKKIKLLKDSPYIKSP
jgi:hypothetical protein